MLSLFATPADKKQVQWFVMRAYKNEIKTEEKLKSERGLQYFIPKHYVIRTYHGVKSRRLVPVLPSLIFVHASHTQITEFKQAQCNQLQFVILGSGINGRYMIVPDEEMENFIKMALRYEESVEYYKPEEINLEKGTRVRIHGGKFDGVEGHFVKVQGKRNRRVVVVLEGVMAIAAEVHPDLLEVIEKPEK